MECPTPFIGTLGLALDVMKVKKYLIGQQLCLWGRDLVEYKKLWAHKGDLLPTQEEREEREGVKYLFTQYPCTQISEVLTKEGIFTRHFPSGDDYTC